MHKKHYIMIGLLLLTSNVIQCGNAHSVKKSNHNKVYIEMKEITPSGLPAEIWDRIAFCAISSARSREDLAEVKKGLNSLAHSSKELRYFMSTTIASKKMQKLLKEKESSFPRPVVYSPRYSYSPYSSERIYKSPYYIPGGHF